jgi:hypothetical protein
MNDVKNTIIENPQSTAHTMKQVETANQIINTFNFIRNHKSPYSWYFLWDENKNDVIWRDGQKEKNFSFVDIEWDSQINLINLKSFDKSLRSQIFEKTSELKKQTWKPTFSTLDSQNNKNYQHYLSVLYNTFPSAIREKSFTQDEQWNFSINEYGIHIIKNLWKTVKASYTARSMDSLRDTLGWSSNFDVMDHITTKEDVKYVFDLIDYLTAPGENRWKKGIFLNRAAALITFLWWIDLEQVKKDMSWIENNLKLQNIRRSNLEVRIESRFKDVYSSVQKLISQPDNNSFLSDLQGVRFTFSDKNLLKNSIKEQCNSIIHYINDINDINQTKSCYSYKIKKINIVNKGILSSEEESELIESMNNNKTLSNISPIEKRKSKTNPKVYDIDIIASVVQQTHLNPEDIQSLLLAASSMKTGANGTYEDLKVIVLLDMKDETTWEEKEIWIEIINQMANNENNKNRANHNFLESQKHTLSRARDKGYNTTQKIYKYISKAILATSQDLIKLRNKITKWEVLETSDRYEEQCYYTFSDGNSIDLRTITNNQSSENKKNIDQIVHDLLLSWLSEWRICIDNNNWEWEKLQNTLYDTDGELLHIAFRWHNLINNLETTRLQLNNKESSNLKNTWTIIFYPFGGSDWQEKLEASTQTLWRVVQKQLISDHDKIEKEKLPKESS